MADEHMRQAREMLRPLAYVIGADEWDNGPTMRAVAALLAERDALAARAEVLTGALSELVNLKRMIARVDETYVEDGLRFPTLNLTEADAVRAEYKRRKPAAWAAAFALFDGAPAAQPAEAREAVPEFPEYRAPPMKVVAKLYTEADLAAARREGAEGMRERCGMWLAERAHHRLSAFICALPIDPTERKGDARKLCTCDGAGRGPGRQCVVLNGQRLGDLWQCAQGHEPHKRKGE